MSSLYTLEEFRQAKAELEAEIASELRTFVEQFGVPVTGIRADIETYGAGFGKPEGQHIINNVQIDVDV